MTENSDSFGGSYTEVGRAAILAAAHDQPDLLGWLVSVLTSVAGELKGSRAQSAACPDIVTANTVRPFAAGGGEADTGPLRRRRP